MAGRPGWTRAAVWTRDAAAIYLAMVFLLWLGQHLVDSQGPWLPAATVTVFIYTARQLALRRYGEPRDGADKRLLWIILACGLATICLVGELTLALRDDFEAG